MTKSDYEVSVYVTGEIDPDSEIELALRDVVFGVKDWFTDVLNKGIMPLESMHPRSMISMVICNILVNLMFNAITVTDIPRRLTMLNEALEEITKMSVELWMSLETARADSNNIQ